MDILVGIFFLEFKALHSIILRSYYEDLFAVDAQTPTIVNVASKAYRAVRLPEVCTRALLILFTAHLDKGA